MMAPERTGSTWPSTKPSTWHFLLIGSGVREGKDHFVVPCCWVQNGERKHGAREREGGE